MIETITWTEKVAFVGMTVVECSTTLDVGSCYQHRVKVSIPYGYGNTVEKAVENAATGMNMCWSSIERKMTELEWQRISHT